MSSSHFSPCHPAVQTHSKPEPDSAAWHVPWAPHASLAAPHTSSSHVLPPKPEVQEHENPNRETDGLHVPPCLHGEDWHTSAEQSGPEYPASQVQATLVDARGRAGTHVPWSPHGLSVRQMSSSHCLPWKPFLHWHVYLRASVSLCGDAQTPAFLHGDDAHTFTSVAQLSPL